MHRKQPSMLALSGRKQTGWLDGSKLTGFAFARSHSHNHNHINKTVQSESQKRPLSSCLKTITKIVRTTNCNSTTSTTTSKNNDSSYAITNSNDSHNYCHNCIYHNVHLHLHCHYSNWIIKYWGMVKNSLFNKRWLNVDNNALHQRMWLIIDKRIKFSHTGRGPKGPSLYSYKRIIPRSPRTFH